MDMLEEKKLKEMEEIFSVFGVSFGFKQDLCNFLRMAKRNELNLDQLIAYLETIKRNFEKKQKEQLKKQALWKTRTLHCPTCNAYMRLATVNTNSANQTGDLGDKSVWMCPNQDCLETIYNKETINEILN